MSLLSIASDERKDSAHNIKDEVEAVHQHATGSTLFMIDPRPAPDVVTNDERAKSPDVLRVLSPMRQRRTPKLHKAPDVTWHLPPHLRHMPSFDSVLSTATATSDVSTVRPPLVAPHNIALPDSTRSSLFTVTPVQDDPSAIPLPPSPPSSSPPASPPLTGEVPRVDTSRFNEAAERQRPGQGHYFHQPHLLSPVTEVSSVPSVLSSLNLDPEIATAERYRISDVRRHAVQVIGASQASLASQQSRHSRFQERFGCDGAEHCASDDGTPDVEGVNGTAGREMQAGEQEVNERRMAKTICARIKRLRQKVSRLGQRFGERITRTFSVRVMARGLGLDVSED